MGTLNQSDFDECFENLGWRFACNLQEKCHPVFDNHKSANGIYKSLKKNGIIKHEKIVDANHLGQYFTVVFETHSDLKEFIYDLTVYVNKRKEEFKAVPFTIKLPDESNSV